MSLSVATTAIDEGDSNDEDVFNVVTITATVTGVSDEKDEWFGIELVTDSSTVTDATRIDFLSCQRPALSPGADICYKDLHRTDNRLWRAYLKTGTETREFRIGIFGDTLVEEDEIAAFRLVPRSTTANEGWPASSNIVKFTIRNDDYAPPVVDVSTNALTVAEGGSGTYTVKLGAKPSGDVTVKIRGATGDVSVADTALTFTQQNYGTAQTVTVRAAHDRDADTDADVTLTHHASGGGYAGVSIDPVVVSVTEDDEVGLVFSEKEKALPEAFWGTYLVKLATEPSGDVTVKVRGATDDVRMESDTSLTFTKGNYNTQQVVRLFAVKDNDAIAEVVKLTHHASGGGYDAAPVDTVTIRVIESDTAGVTVSVSELAVSEGGTGTYTIKLATEPSDTVKVKVRGATGDVTVSDTALLFTTTDYGTAQTVTVSAAEDNDAIADADVTLTHHAEGGDYESVSIGSVVVSVTENDTAGATVSVTELEVVEGGSATYTVKLNSEPSDDVTVKVRGMSGDVSVADTVLTFTTGNYNTAKTVTVRAAEDDDDDTDANVTLTHHASGGGYGSVTLPSVVVSVKENDLFDVVVSVTELEVVEGGSGTYTIKLAAEPVGINVPGFFSPAETTIKVRGFVGSDVTVADTALTFTDQNYSVAQTVTVNAAEDTDAFADADVTLTHHASGGNYGGVPIDSVVVSVTENDTAGVTASVSELEVGEGGSAAYTIKLDSEPSGNVTVKVRGFAGSDVTVADTALTFTPQNYSVAKTVTVSAAQDNDAIADADVTLTHHIEGGGYESVSISSVVVTVTEDDVGGATVSVTELAVAEGDSATYTIKLDSEPSDNVTVKVRGMAGDVSVADSALTFTTENYGTAQTVTVRAAEDPDGVTNPTVTLTHHASGGGYSGASVGSVVVSVTENDTAGATVSVTDLEVTEGGSATYTIRLDTEPYTIRSGLFILPSDVTVKVRGVAGDVTVADTALTFTAQNYATPQTITVRAAEDDDAITDPKVTLTHHASGADYDLVSIASVVVSVAENDVAGATVSLDTLEVTEGGSGTYTIKLNSEPSDDVTVKVRGAAGDVTVADTALTFTTENYGTAQTVTVRAAEDDDADTDAPVTLTHHASGGGYGGVSIDSVVVFVTDNDVAGVEVSVANLAVPEGDSASYTIKLRALPSNTVTLKVRGMSGDVTVSDTALTFTTQNYSAAQTVWVRAAHDSDAVTDAAVSLKHHAEGGGYASVTIDSVVVTVTEDDTPGVMVSETALAVDEGDSASYTVKLNTEPSNTVTLKVRGMSGDVTVSDTALTFTAQNYGAAQTVWVRAAHDSDAVTDATVSLKHHAEGGEYASVTIDSVVVTVTEDDTPGVMVSETALTVDEGDSASYTVKLDTEPSNTVTVKVRGMSGDVTVSDTALTFTAQNYSAAQTVWVRAAHDPDAVTDAAVALTHHAEGGGYASVTIDSLVVTVTEDDTPGVTVSAPVLAVDEGDSASYTVKLDTEPSNTVTLKVRGMSGDVTVSDTALTFTAQNYGAAQTVWVRAAHDPDANADPAVTLTHHASGGDYASVPVAEVAVSVIEDDTVGATVSVTDLNVTEGSSATYTIKLNALPSGDVTVKIRGFVGTDVSVADTALTFTTVNYDTAQTVTVRAAHDPDGIEGAPVTLTHHASGGGYGSVSISSVRVQVKEDDAVGVTISETKLTVLEGDSASYTIRLNTKPVQNRHPQIAHASRQSNANVTIRIDGASGDVTVSPASLTFTDSNWDTAQTVWVHAAHDPDGDTDPTVTLRHRADGAHYGYVIADPWTRDVRVPISGVAVTVTEDDIPGATISETELEVAEGGSATYTIKLNTAPTDDVTVKIRGASGDVSVSDTSLTFTAQNFDTAQTVTVSAAEDNDAIVEADVALTHHASGGGYGSVAMDSVVVSVTENDTAGATVSVTELEVGEGDSATYTIKLNAEPSGDVTVKIRGFGSSDVSVADTALTFTAGNYGTAQTVTVRAAEDNDAITDAGVALTHHASGGGYGGVSIAGVAVSVTENDTAGVTVSVIELDVTEGDSATYTIKLDSEPSGDVTVKIRGFGGSDVSLADTALTFTAQDYGTAQTVTVRAAEDNDAVADGNVMLSHVASGGGYGGVSIGSVIVSVQENDVAGGTLSVDTLEVTEGGSATYTIKLDTEPTGNVTVKVRGASGDVSVADTALTFTTQDYGTAQTVTVSAAEDIDALKDPDVTLTHHYSGGGYTGVAIDSVVVSVKENDVPGATVSVDTLEVTEGGSGTYTIKLDAVPSDTVTVKVRGASGDVTVADTVLIFTTANYGTAQTVTVRAAEDSDAITDADVTLTHHPSGGGYGSVAIASVVVTVTENDVPGATVTTAAGFSCAATPYPGCIASLEVPEGDSLSYTIKLNTEPSGNVTVKVRGASGDVSVSDTSLTFTTANYDTAQTVWVRAAEDSDGEREPEVSLTHHPTGGGYDGVSLDSAAVTVLENDTAGVTVSVTELEVPEGDSASYTIKLDTEPLATVVIASEIRADPGDVSVSIASLTFTTTNYDTAQTVWVRAAEDGDAFTDDPVTLSHVVTVGSQQDQYVTTVKIDSVVVSVTENDTAGATVSVTELEVDEGGSGTYTVKLNTEPSDDVTVKIRGFADSDVSVSDTALTFTTQNYGTAQTVTVRAADDDDAISDADVTLTHHASGGGYGSVSIGSVVVTVAENDTAGVTLSRTKLTVLEGDSASYTVKLNTEPSGNVTVKVRGLSGDVTVADTALTFTTGNYGTAQTVWVNAAEDNDIVTDPTVTLTHHASGGGYDSVSIGSVVVTVTENDVPGATVSVTELEVAEGGSGTYTVKLNTEPSDTVTVKIRGASGDVTVADTALKFTTGNYGTAQTVTVNAAEDPDAATDPTVTLTHHSSGGGYGSVSIGSVTVTVTENDTVGATVSESTLTVAEGDSASYTVKLNTEPSGNVTVKVRGLSSDVTVADTSLTFTTQNYGTAQTVWVRAAEDPDAATDPAVTLTHHASGGGYASAEIANVVVSVTENDVPGATVSVTELEVPEGGSGTYTVKLNTEPSDTVKVKVRGMSGDVTVADTALTFTTEDYGTAQTVTVNAAQDNDAITEAGVTLTHHASGGGYGSITIGNVVVTVTEDDTAGVTLSRTELTVLEGGSGTYTVKLDTEPSGNVTVKVRGASGDVTVADTALTFTTGNYGTAQTITVSAAEDNDIVTDANVALTHHASGGGYGSVSIDSVIVSVTENDVPGATVSVTELEVAEGGSGTYTVKLNTEPSDTVTVKIRGASGDVSVTDTALMFTTGNYGTAQTVTVNAAEDDDAVADAAVTLTHHASGGGYGSVTIGSVTVTVTENDTVGATLSESALTVGEGDSASYTVRLNTEPTGSVTVKIRGMSGDVTVADTSLTFTTTNYDTAQTVWVRAAEDPDAVTDATVTLTHHASGGGYASAEIDSVVVTVTEKDEPGVTVSLNALTVTEGDSASYTVKLNTPPSVDVTVKVEGASGDVTVADTLLTFTQTDYGTAQTVWVRAAHDADAIADPSVRLSHASSGGEYEAIEIGTVLVTVEEDDTVGVTPSRRTLTVTEGDSASYTVKLDTEPSGNVTVKVRGMSGDVTVADTALTFTTANYDTAQTVWVRAGDDPDAATDAAVTLTHHASGGGYGSASVDSVVVTVTEDDVPGATVSVTELEVVEGASGTYTVKLNTAPSDTVTVKIRGTSGDVSVADTALKFTTGNYGTAQTVTVNAAEDDDAVADAAVTLTHHASGGGYGSVTIGSVTVTVTENDTVGATVSESALTVVEGGSGTYTIRLNTEPPGNVTVKVRGASDDVTVADTSLTFTTGNYGTAQTVTVNAAEDADAATDATVTLTHHASGGGYASADIASVVVTVTENDTAGVTVSQSALTVVEGASGTYTVKLNTEPSGNVTVKVRGASGDVSVADTALTFTTGNYGTAQTVRVRAAEDPDANADAAVTLTHHASGGGYGSVSIGSVVVTVTENDTVGATVSVTDLEVLEGGSATYTIKLDAQPTGNVTVKVRGASGDVTVADTALTFTQGNFASAQTVTVNAADDNDAITDDDVTLTHHASGGGYGSVSIDSVVVSVTENDVAGATVSVANLAVPEGDSSSYTVRLNAEPTGNVTVKVRGASGDVSVADTSLTFTTANYDTAQTVWVRAAEDDDAVADAAVTLTHHASGGGYGSVTIRSVVVTVTENDSVAMTRPDPPQALRGLSRDGAVVLSWTVGGDGGAALTGHEYRMRVGESGDWGEWTEIGSSGAGGANVAGYTVTGLVNGTAYMFAVRAVNRVGASDASDAVTVTPEPTVTVPPALELRGEPGDGAAVLSWIALGDGGSAITGHQYRMRGSGGWGEWTAIESSAAGEANEYGYTVTGLVNDSVYTFVVRAVNEVGAGPESNAVAVTPVRKVPPAPGELRVEPGDGAAMLFWTVDGDGGSGITGHQYRMRLGGSTEWGSWTDIVWTAAAGDANAVGHALNTYSYMVTGLANGTTYAFEVRVVNEVGPGPASSTVTVTPTSTATVPAAPGELRGEPGDGLAVLSWTVGGDGGSAITAHHYRMRMGGSADWGAWTEIESSGAGGANAAGYMVTGLVNDSTYTFEVRAVNEVGPGSESNAVTVTPEATATVPAAPDELRGEPGDGLAVLSWTVGGDGGSAITAHHYRMRVGVSADWGAWTEIESSAAGGANAAGYTVTGLVNDSTYTFEVRAVNEVGAGPASNAVAVTPEAAVTVPEAPGALQGEPGDGLAVLSWTVGGDGGSAITAHHYRMRVGVSADWGAWTEIESSAAGGANAAGYTVTGLVNDSTYTFEVRAVNEVGAGPASNAVAVTPEAAVTVPEAPGALQGEPGDGLAVLSWTVGGDGGSAITAHHYRMRMAGSTDWGMWTDIESSGAGEANAAGYTVTGLVNDSTYTFEVRAVNEVGPGPESNAVDVTPEAAVTVPEAPGDLRGEAGDGLAVLSWTVSGDGGNAITAHQYRMRMGGSADWGLWADVPSSGAGGANAAGYTVTGLVNGTAYTFEVRAVNGVGPGPASNAVAVTPEAEVTVSEAEMSESLAALGRGYLSSARMTLSRWLEGPGRGSTQVTVRGRRLPLGVTEAVNEGRSSISGWWTGLLSQAAGAAGVSGGGHGHAVGVGVSGSGAGGSGGGVNLGLPGLGLGSGGGIEQSSFSLALGGRQTAGEGSGTWAVWGQGDVQNFEGVGASRYDGRLMTAWLGVDRRVNDGWVLGLAATRSVGESGWQSGGKAGGVETTLTAAHPYARWSNGSTTVWAMMGVGRGEAEAMAEGRESETRPLSLAMGLVDFRQRLVSGGFGLDLRGDAAWMGLETDAYTGMGSGLSVPIHQGRIGMEATGVVGSSGWRLTPFGGVSARWDGGSGQTGFGLELAGGLRVAGSGLEVDAQGRALVLHEASGYREHGFGVSVRYGSGSEGQGLNLSVAPRWGSSARDSGMLWQEQLRRMRPGAEGGVNRSGLDARVGYGWRLSGGQLVSPYGSYGMSGHGGRMQVGAQVAGFGGGVGDRLRLGVLAERAPGLGGGHDHRFGLQGFIGFGGSPR